MATPKTKWICKNCGNVEFGEMMPEECMECHVWGSFVFLNE